MARNIAVQELKQYLYPIEADLRRPLFLVAFGCTHKGAENHAAHDWQKFCEYYKTFSRKNWCLFIGMGDYIEFFSNRERQALASPDIHESTWQKFDKEGNAAVDDFYNDISFMSGNLLGLIEGNHFWEFTDGTTSTNKLCDKLKCRYLAGGLYGKLKLFDKYAVRHSIDIYAAHGSGNTLTIGGSIMKGERFSGAVKANIYLLGHDHQHIVADVPLIELHYGKKKGTVRTVEYKRCVVRSGSFYRLYIDNSKSYGINRLYKPTGIGNAQIEIRFSENNSARYFTLNPQLKSW